MAQAHVQILIGSVREGRVSGAVGRWVARRFEVQCGWPAEIVDLRDWGLPDFDLPNPPAVGPYRSALQRAWARTIRRADAFIVVVPEYNHGPPAALKNAFDWIYAEWAGKPAVFLSFGNANGVRAIQQLKLVMSELRMAPLEPTVALRPHGQIHDRRFEGSEAEELSLQRAVAELLRWQGVLRDLREPAPELLSTRARVQVVGLDPSTNRSVVTPLIASGVDAEGLILAPGDGIPDGAGYDLVAIGRGAAGATAAAIRRAVHAAGPATPVLDVVGPVAVRQVLAALDPQAPQLRMDFFELAGRRLSLRAVGDDGSLTITAYERTPVGLVPHRAARVRLHGEIELSVNLPVSPYSVVADLDGAAFCHLARRGQE